VPGKGGTGGGGGATSGPGGAGGQGEAADGGAIFSNGVVRLTNVTLSGNLAAGSAGGDGGPARAAANPANGGAGSFGGGGGGGALALFNGAAGQLASVTIASNSTTDASGGTGGHGVHGGAAGANGTLGVSRGGNLFVSAATLSMRGSIVASGVSHAGAENCSIVPANSFTDLGNNLDDGHQCIVVATSGDLHDVPAVLGPLQDNGGPTQTRALLGGSGAIGAGAPACTDVGGQPLTTDQRGLSRGTPCDIGAFEGQPPAAATPTVAGSPVAGAGVTCALGASGGDVPQTNALQWLLDGAPIAGATASSYTVTAADVGHALSCQLTLSNPFGSSTATSSAVTALPPPPPKPVLKSLKLSPKHPRNKHKETISFSLTGAAAKVKFTLQRVPMGVKVGKRCVRRSRGHPHGKACRLRPAKVSAAPRQIAARLGANKLTWKPKRLKPGGYRLTAKPAGGAAVTVAFTVRR
jgi:hypothetical protein